MYVIGAANPKGGVGKSFISWMLAGHYDALDFKTAIWDLDPQKSCSFLKSKGNVDFDVLDARPASDRYDILIVDHPPKHLDKLHGDVIVSPTKAGSIEADAMARSGSQYHGKPVVHVVNNFRMTAVQKQYAIQHRRVNNALWVKQRSIYEDAIEAGITVYQMKKKTSVYAAIDEINNIALRVEKWLTNQD